MRIFSLPSLVICGIALAPAPLAAQTSDAGPAFNRPRTPVSPAFVLLGVAPTEVERPNTPADLAFSILNHSAALTSLPRDVAMELSPYWLMKHPTLTWEQDTVRSVGASLARTLSISFGTAEVGTSSRPVTGLALGFRAAPFSGHVPDSATKRLRALGNRLGIESAVIARLRQRRLDDLEQIFNREFEQAHTDSARQAASDRFSAARQALTRTVMTDSPEYKAAVDSTNTLFKDLALSREGFVLEVAAGAALDAPGAVVDSASLARWGAWLTAGYVGTSLSFVVVNRFLSSSVDSTFDSIDLGMRLIYTTGRYALSTEASFRSFTQQGAPGNEYRIAALADFEIQNGLWLTGAFGRDYATGTAGSLIAQFGLSVNVAGERVKIPLR